MLKWQLQAWRRLYTCLGCLLGEFFNAGLFNISADGVVLTQRGAYVVPPMTKERGPPREVGEEGQWDFRELHVEDSGRLV